ncbi:MAG TPA: slipin family protein [Blastocatellia bacterium]|nr:slipin family protein [Blastocatellia bacterium]
MYDLILILIIGLTAAILFALAFKRVTVFEYERGLQYSKGRFSKILGPGVYWRSYRTVIKKLDVRPQVITLPGQELLSADGVGIKISLTARYEIADPDAAVNKIENYLSALYIELQSALREIVGSLKMDELLERRAEMAAKLLGIAEKPAAEFGLRLLSVNVKDVMFPGELKKIFAQVVKARQEGLAALEKARGESAALRNLANAARVLENNPALMQLRLLQALGETSGNTIVLDTSAYVSRLLNRTRGNGEPATTPPEED